MISDLHLGAHHGADVLRRRPPRDALVAALEGVDRLVLLGDVLELRHGPRADALRAAGPVFEAFGAAMAGGEIVLVPGNHDHGIAARWLDDAPDLGLEERRAPADASPLAARVAERLAPAHVEVAYPGLWLRDDVYATHGHYLDLHTTVPTFERLGAGLMARLAGAPSGAARPADYEAVLAPLYAWIDASAQRVRAGRRAAGAGRAGQAWTSLTAAPERPLRARALLAALPLVAAAVNRAGLGQVHPDLSGEALRRGGLAGMREAAARLRIDAPHLVFGHTHRSGPLPDDDPLEWLAGATRMHNAGSWVFERRFVGYAGPAGPYWPGAAVEVGGDGAPPQLHRLLAGLSAADLRPARA